MTCEGSRVAQVRGISFASINYADGGVLDKGRLCRPHTMTRRKLVGVLTPSSDTALEPLTSAIVSGVPGVSAHFSRLTIAEISMHAASLNQFDDSKILDAAHVLADAHVGVICWTGGRHGARARHPDLRLCCHCSVEGAHDCPCRPVRRPRLGPLYQTPLNPELPIGSASAMAEARHLCGRTP